MNVILLGPPGAGKGTQGDIISREYSLPRISTGDLLREAVRKGTPLGRQAQGYMDQGLLVPDSVILGLIEEVLERPESEDGILMDGFPRTVAQAESVDETLDARGCEVDFVLLFEAPEEELVQRMLGRAAREGRSDDNAEAIRKRLQVYREQTEPLIAFYEERGVLERVDALGTVDDIADRVRDILG